MWRKTTRAPALAAAAAVVVGLSVCASASAAGSARTQTPISAEVTTISQGAEAAKEVGRSRDLFRGGPAGPPGVPSPGAPALLSFIDAINFDAQAATAGFYRIPPDPAAAAGPDHLVNVVNSVIEWREKSSANLTTQSLDTFFNSLAPVDLIFDPKVVYDHFNDRFVVVALSATDPPAAPESQILLAVSDDEDPNGTWYFHSIDGKLNIGGSDTWADFPGLAVSSDAVYVTVNQFRFSTNTYAGPRLWIVEKTPLYTGGAAVDAVFDPIASASGDPALGMTLQPTQMFGTAPAGVGTWLVGYNALNDSDTGGTHLYLEMIRVDDPTTSPVFTNTLVQWGVISGNEILVALPDSPQLGSKQLIDTGDRRVSQAPVWRDDMLYVAANTYPSTAPNKNQVTARWWMVDTSTLATPTLDDMGIVGGENLGPATHTFYPTVAVDSEGRLGIGFAATGTKIYPGAFYTARVPSDPAGATEPASPLALGTAPYFRTFGNPTMRNRWGDYTGISLDPDDDRTFWLYNEYAMTQGTILPGLSKESGRWATRLGSFQAGRPVISGFTPPAAVGGASVTINGSRLGGAGLDVEFNGEDAAVTSQSPTQIVALVPTNATLGPINVTTDDGTAASSTAFKPLPKLDSITPNPAKVGDVLTLTGTNFLGATGNVLGTLGIDSVDSATQITTMALPANAVTGLLGVTTPAGTSNKIQLNVVPTITSFLPTSGGVGTVVVLTGNTFTGTKAVKVNGLSAKFKVLSPTTLRVTIPKNATDGPFAVTNAGGTTTSATSFDVLP